MSTKITNSDSQEGGDKGKSDSLQVPKASVEADEKVIKSLNDKIIQLKQENRRVKFLAFLIILILLDFMMFQQIANWAGGLVIGMLQLILLLFIGKILEIEDVDLLITRILGAFTRSPPEDIPNRSPENPSK